MNVRAWLAGAAVAAIGLAPATAAWKAALLHSFDGTDGAEASGGLSADAAGNFYGVTCAGGRDGHGTVFELRPPEGPGLGWTAVVLHSFGAREGMCPSGNIVLDAAGDVFGTALRGGAHGDGTVFEVEPPRGPGAGWRASVLHAFDLRDGYRPTGVALGADGALYGATSGGGRFNQGTVYRLAPPGGPGLGWTETVLRSFRDGYSDPQNVILDGSGNVYGDTMFSGDVYDAGTVFRLTPPAEGHGAWTNTVLHVFHHSDGYAPGGLVLDAAGNLYGWAAGGVHQDGLVFKLAPPEGGRGRWHETVLHVFDHADGSGVSSLVMDEGGDLYGTTLGGGRCFGASGVVFSLQPPRWNETVLACFGSHAGFSAFGLAFDGDLFGLSRFGGRYGEGSAYRLTP
jgi:uncharacterized repeat protein (TIGR03803 family)